MTTLITKSMIASVGAAAILSTGALTTAQAGAFSPQPLGAVADTGTNLVEKVGRRGRVRRGVGIGAGIVTLGILGAIAADRAHARDRYYRDDYRHQCRRWRRWCRNGDDRACWRYDSRC